VKIPWSGSTETISALGAAARKRACAGPQLVVLGRLRGGDEQHRESGRFHLGEQRHAGLDVRARHRSRHDLDRSLVHVVLLLQFSPPVLHATLEIERWVVGRVVFG
jgi:hypothetical protein